MNLHDLLRNERKCDPKLLFKVLRDTGGIVSRSGLKLKKGTLDVKKSCSKLKTLKMCSAKTTCSFEFSYKAGHEVMVVHSKPGETVGKHHHCAFNYSSRKCECRCWGPKFSAIWTGQGSQQPVIRETPVVQVAQPGVVVDQKAFHEVPVITNFALLGTAAV